MESDFIKNEHDILDFWQKNSCFEKLQEKNKNGKPFRFLESIEREALANVCEIVNPVSQKIIDIEGDELIIKIAK